MARDKERMSDSSVDHPRDRRAASSLEIRDMELEDLSPVFHLGEQLFTRDVPNLYRTWDEYEVTEYFQSEPELALVADLGGRLVGFAMGTIYEKRRSSWSYGHMTWIGVDPQAARRGVGSRLFREMLSRLERLGARMLVVDTEADNDAALAFFAKHGFGTPHKHLYLSLNLSARRSRMEGRSGISALKGTSHNGVGGLT